MQTVTQNEMLRLLEEKDVAWMQKITHGGKTWLYMKITNELPDTIYRTEVQG